MSAVVAPVLVAGVGNIFFGDDGFGPHVAQALARDAHPGVSVEDYGIRGLHLAYDLLSGYERAIIVDAVPRGGAPGTLYVIDPVVDVAGVTADAHRMDIGSVLAFVRTLGGVAPPITIVGCEPECVEPGLGVSDAVSQAIPMAAELVRRLIDQERGLA